MLGVRSKYKWNCVLNSIISNHIEKLKQKANEGIRKQVLHEFSEINPNSQAYTSVILHQSTSHKFHPVDYRIY